jgi:hypothetical protein
MRPCEAAPAGRAARAGTDVSTAGQKTHALSLGCMMNSHATAPARQGTYGAPPHMKSTTAAASTNYDLRLVDDMTGSRYCNERYVRNLNNDIKEHTTIQGTLLTLNLF